MRLLSSYYVCTILSICVGNSHWHFVARSDRAKSITPPLLEYHANDARFRLPSSPVVMAIGIGRIPVSSGCGYLPIPPVIRLTNLGIRLGK